MELASNLTFDKDLRADGMIVCLYGRLVELSHSISALIDSERTAGVHSLFRTFLEAYVDFKNLSEQPEYIEQIMISYEKHWLKILRKGDGNQYLAEIWENKDITALIDDQERKINEFKEAGHSELNNERRFELAEMEDVYNSIYRMSSQDVHNGFGAVSDRHIESHGDSFRLVFFKAKELSEFLTIIDSTLSLLLAATVSVHSRLGSSELKKVNSIQNSFQNLQKQYM